MHHFVDAITDTKGNALIGYFVRCVDSTTGLSASLYADTSLTPILSVSGVANAAQVDSDGNADFYIPSGTYHLDIYATDSTTFVRRIQNLPMIEDVNSRPIITPQSYGAKGDGVTNDGPAFVAAIAALKAEALNAGGGAYKGSRSLFIPAGDYYLGTTTLDINHTLIIQGEGSGRAPAPAYGCTHLRWADGVCGIRIQFPSTSGTTTVDSGHDGAGSVYISDLSMQGGYTSTNSASHAIVARAITYLNDVLIRQWSGTGVLSWTGNVNAVAYSGNTSVSRYTGVKVEGCKVGFDTRGTDSNVITFLNCEGYQCRQAGFIDDNGAGSNTYIGTHATANGVIGGSGVITQVSNSGHYYAVKWGLETAAATNAPSGTTDDNTWWIYTGSGAADSAHPAWVSGMSGLTSGGDYVMLSNYPTVLINCYSEGGGFSQLNVGTLAIGGTNLGLTSAGGTCLVPEYDGLAFKRLHGASTIHLDGASNSAGGFDVREGGTNWVGGANFSAQTASYFAGATNGHQFYTIVANVATYRGSWTQYGIAVPAGSVYYVNSLQVLAARKTGWTVATGTATRTAFDTTTVTLPQLAERVKALIDDLHSTAGHGMIGT